MVVISRKHNLTELLGLKMIFVTIITIVYSIYIGTCIGRIFATLMMMSVNAQLQINAERLFSSCFWSRLEKIVRNLYFIAISKRTHTNHLFLLQNGLPSAQFTSADNGTEQFVMRWNNWMYTTWAFIWCLDSVCHFRYGKQNIYV